METYAEMAKILFNNLFGIQVEESGNETFHHSLAGEFISVWADIVKLSFPTDGDGRMLPLERFKRLSQKGKLSESQTQRLDEIRRFRNELVHGMSSPTQLELQNVLKDLKELYKILQNLASA